MSVVSIDQESVCLYQQFDDKYPAFLAPFIARAAYRSHVRSINLHWRRASLLYLLTLLGFLLFALGPILLGAAANAHNFTGVDEEVGIAMLLIGALFVVSSVVLVRYMSRRMLLSAVQMENEKLKGSATPMRFRLVHETVAVPAKQADNGAVAVAVNGEHCQRRVESSEYQLLFEVGEPLPGTTPTVVSSATAEATQLTSISTHFALDPTAARYQPHLCPHCLQDSPPSAVPRSVFTSTTTYPVHTFPTSTSHPAVSPLLAAHLLSTLPRSVYAQPLPASLTGIDSISINIPPSPTDTLTHAPQPAEAQHAAAGQ